MKRSISLILVIVALATLITSCSKGNKFVADGLGYVDKETEVSYSFAPFCYEPIELGEKIYGSDGELEFYEIVGQDPKLWLGEKDGGVFYAEGVTLPTIDKMNISELQFCTTGEQIFVRERINSELFISDVISEYLSAQPLYYLNSEAELTYKLRFVDQTLGIYYCLEFLRYDGEYTLETSSGEINYGKDFIYNRSEDRFIKAPAAISERIDSILGIKK